MKSATSISLISVIGISLIAGCTGNEDDVCHKTRLEAFGDRYRPHTKDSISLRGSVTPDTAVFICGVEFPPDYDWRRDTSFGNIQARIILMRDGCRVMEIPAGGGSHASTDPDLHHLVDGHVYTEFTYGKGTVIGRDGADLFTYQEKEILRGLMVEGDEVWTLGQYKDKDGFALRRNGVIVMEKENGQVAGRITDRMDYPGGALYRDSGHLYFAYWRPAAAGSMDRAWYIVEDGQETQVQVESSGIYDIRVKDGTVIKTPVTPSHSLYNKYTDGETTVTVVAYSDGSILISYPGMKCDDPEKGGYYFFSYRNACLSGKTLYLALTPFEKGKAPFLWRNGTVSEIEMNGFVTAVDVSVLPREGS